MFESGGPVSFKSEVTDPRRSIPGERCADEPRQNPTVALALISAQSRQSRCEKGETQRGPGHVQCACFALAVLTEVVRPELFERVELRHALPTDYGLARSLSSAAATIVFATFNADLGAAFAPALVLALGHEFDTIYGAVATFEVERTCL